MENLNEGKKKKMSYMAELAEIDKQSAIVAMEAKINKLAEMIEAKNTRLSMVSEDENLSELIDKKRVKDMQKEIKILEKEKSKMEKMYEKMHGGKKKEMVDEKKDEMDEGHGMSMYDEDDSMKEEIMAEEELDEMHCSEEDDSVKEEEVNEEFSRWQKLAGITTLKEGLDKQYATFLKKLSEKAGKDIRSSIPKWNDELHINYFNNFIENHKMDPLTKGVALKKQKMLLSKDPVDKKTALNSLKSMTKGSDFK